MLWILLDLGCQFNPVPKSSIQEEELRCDPRTLGVNEIRFRPFLCGDEDIKGGAIRRGDWILENNQLRLGLRQPSTSLSTLEGTGGSIVDFSLVEGRDSVLEILPYQDGVLDIEDWEITESEDEISIQFLPLEGGIRLRKNDNQLQFFGEFQWLFRGLEGSELIGQELLLPMQDPVLYIQAEIDSLGSELLLSKLEFVKMAQINAIFSDQEDALDLELQSNGERVLLYQEEHLIGFFPIEEGHAQGAILNSVSHLQVTKQGCLPSELTPIASSQLDVGDCGSVLIRLNERGEEINGLLSIAQETFFISKQGQRIPLTTSSDQVIISAGFEYELIELDSFDPFAHSTITVSLQRTLPPTHSISLHNLIHPDPSIQRTRTEIIEQNMGQQIDYALLSAQNIVPSRTRLLSQYQTEIIIEEGLLSLHSEGSILSFPWSQSNLAAFGAIPIDQVTLEEALSFASQKQRFLILDYGAMTNIEPETLWQEPQFLWIQSQVDALDFAESCGEYPYSRPVSSHIWLPDLSQEAPSKVEIEQELRIGELGLGNGALLETEMFNFDERANLLQIKLYATTQNQPQRLSLYSNEGLERTWSLTDFPFAELVVLPQKDVFCLVAWSEDSDRPAWALSTPIYSEN